MAKIIDSLNIESVVAWLFGISALAALVMTSWAYVYQTLSRNKKSNGPQQSATEGHFFKRVMPPTRYAEK